MSVTWNPADKGALLTLSNGNLTVEANTYNAYDSVRATISRSGNKWYWEILVDNRCLWITVGVGNSSASLNDPVGTDANGWGYRSDAKKWNNNFGPAYGNTYTTGDIIGVALDMVNGKIWFSKNNVWQAAGDPVAGTNEAYSGITGSIFPMSTCFRVSATIDTQTIVPDYADLTYAPPAGFHAIGDYPPTKFDGKLVLSPITTVFDGKLAVSPVTTVFDGKLAVSPVTTVFDGKVRVKDSTTDQFDGKARVKDSATNLFDGKILAAYTGQIDDACPTPTGSMRIGVEISNNAPTPTCDIAAVFRYARIDADVPVPSASFIVGKRVGGNVPVPDFTCIAVAGRNPTLFASAPVPTCLMRVGLSLDAVVPVPTCLMVADTHHLATIFGNVPTSTCTIIASTENIATIYGRVPCPRSKFTTTIANVASICGRCPVPYCSMRALVGTVVSLYGNVPVPGPLVRFYASPFNVTIVLAGDVPVPTMTSRVLCSLPSLILRYERGKIR